MRASPVKSERKEPICGHAAGIAMTASSQLARNVVARSVTEEETKGLHEEHQREDNAHRSRGLRVELSDKEGVGYDIQTRHQHTDNGWNGHCRYYPADGSRRQVGVVVFPSVHGSRLYLLFSSEVAR